jgi:deoxyribonuclease-4
MKRVKRRLAECLNLIRDEGWNVLIGLELTGKQAGFGTLQDIVKVCEDVEGAYPVIDWAHAHARDGGRFEKARDFDVFLQEYEDFTTEFLHCHFSCIEYGAKGEIRHLELEAGSPNFSELAKVLKKRSYDITIICESPIRDRDSLRMKNILRAT